MLSNPLNPNPNVVTDVNHIDGIFRGIVEDNDDPLNLCRLRVRVPYLNGMPNTQKGIPTDGLPWAAACIPYGGPGYGQVLIPEVGSTVWVMFENQAKDRPVWIGCSYGAQSMTGQRKLKSSGQNTFVNTDGEWTYDSNREDTPYTFKEHNKNSKVVIHTPKGFEISIDEADEHECLELIDRTGQIIRMYCPVTKEGNADNQAARVAGSVMDSDINEGILEYAMETPPRDMNYILIESQSNENDVKPSYVRLSKEDVTITDGESLINLHGRNMTFQNGQITTAYDGYDNTFAISNMPNSAFQMSEDNNSISKGSTEIVFKDDTVQVDNGRVGIRLTDAIEFHGPIRWGNGHYGGFWDNDWMRIYYPHIKLATGQSSIILDGGNITVSADDTRIASGESSITVDEDIKLSGNTDLTNETASLSLRDNELKIDSDRSRIASGKSSIEIIDSDKLGDIEAVDGDILINGDTKIANGDSSIIVADEEIDISSRHEKLATGHSSLILHDQYVEANGWIYDTYDEEGNVIHNPNWLGDTLMEDVKKEDTSKDVKDMDDVNKGDVSIDDCYYGGWFTGEHVPMVPVQ